MNQPNRSGNQFGTFEGVFTPSLLTIFGVIMFLRVGFVVGQAGVGQALMVLLLAEVIVLFCAISMSAIATNTPVYGGGSYFLISRSIGPQLGGAIGIALYLAQGLSVPFYIIGFSQSVIQSFPVLQPYFSIITLAAGLLLFFIAFLSARFVLRIQFFVLAILSLSILTMLGGMAINFDLSLLRENWQPVSSPNYLGFGVVFAIYFPAVTGIQAGINMSGDLKNPARSLVRGTFAAIFVGFLVYAVEIILAGGAQSRENLLLFPFQSMLAQSLFGMSFFIIAGVFAATISSALGSFLGAPRVLQALAKDDIISLIKPFKKGTKGKDEPRSAMLLTLLLTLIVIGWATRTEDIGAFDKVAVLLTMIFLCTYGMINVAAFVESFGGNPSFRPRFTFFHWSLSLIGFILCLVAMVLIDIPFAIISVLIIAAIYFLISRKLYQAAFGDARRGFMFTLIRLFLHRLNKGAVHPKNWRPNILVLSGNPNTRGSLLQYGVWLEAGRGLITAAVIMQGKLADRIEERKNAQKEMEQFFTSRAIDAFSEVLLVDDFDEGLRTLVQAQSIGPIKPNTVMLGWPVQSDRIVPYFQHLTDLKAAGLSILCLIEHEPVDVYGDKRIDIWWRGYGNGSLMLILVYLLTLNMQWRSSKIRILRLVKRQKDEAEAAENIKELVQESRIDAEVKIIVSKDSFPAVLEANSHDAALVFLGFFVPDIARANEYYQNITMLTQNLKTVLLVHSNGEADLLV